jgi:hypothetical protein
MTNSLPVTNVDFVGRQIENAVSNVVPFSHMADRVEVVELFPVAHCATR